MMLIRYAPAYAMLWCLPFYSVSLYLRAVVRCSFAAAPAGVCACFQEHGMEEVWDRLRQATGNDAQLVAFLQCLLTLDPAARADFAALSQHPYVQLEEAHASAVLHQAEKHPSAPTPAPMPSAVVLAEAVACIPTMRADTAATFHTVPGIPYLVWDPAVGPICETASGAVYR